MYSISLSCDFWAKESIAPARKSAAPMRGTSFSKVVLLTSKVDTSAKISACFAKEPMRLPASAIDAGMAGEAALGCLDAPNSSLKRIIRTAAPPMIKKIRGVRTEEGRVGKEWDSK